MSYINVLTALLLLLTGFTKLTHPYPLFRSLATVHRINVREVVCGPNLVVELIIFIINTNNNSILIPFI